MSIELKAPGNEESLPDFEGDFPYIASRAILSSYAKAFVPWHWHGAVELFYMEKGSLEYSTPGGKYIFPEGSGGFVNANVLHATKPAGGGETVQLLHIFEPSLIAGERGSRPDRKYVMPLVTDPGTELIALDPDVPEQAALLEQIRQAFELSPEEWGYELKLREALAEIWLGIFELAKPSGKAGDAGRESGRIKQMMAYVHENYAGHISVEELAGASFISKRACFRLFREQLDMSPGEYIRSYRLQQACRMLAGEESSITEIASRCGLGSASYFGKLFGEQFGCTPQEYRRFWRDGDKKGRK